MTHLINRNMLNPVARRWVVDRMGLLASIQHRGRRSGKQYLTPVLAVRFGEGFLVPLPYGLQVDWFRNLTSAQECVLVWKKHKYAVGKPQIITLRQTQRAYPWPIRWIFRAGGVNHHVVLINSLTNRSI
ncbi:MAG TPA: hypothetical protein VEF72_14850 [Mycobacterium sp.]|nr:hypothetical protein [Mycobacterium sp.]